MSVGNTALLAPALFALSTGCATPPPRTPALPATARITRTAGGEATLSALLEEAADASAVCVGEQHDDPAHHRFQHAVLRNVIARAPEARWGIGFEMFQRPAQPVLDEYARGDIDAATLYRVSRWEDRWGFGFEMYQPLLETAHDQSLTMLALNAPRELTRAIARQGIENLPREVKASLPELDLGNADHRRFFFSAMGFSDGGGAHGGANAERFYAAQVTWDETMAETAAAFLAADDRKLVIVAGNGHCHRVAIPDRIVRRRPGRKVLSVLLQSGDDGMPDGITGDWVVTLPPETSGSDADGAATAQAALPDGGLESARVDDVAREVFRRLQ